MLSVILGVRRASITTTLAELERTGGLVRQRGGIDVCDRAALERRTCECYQIIASEYGHLNRNGLHEHRIPAAIRPDAHLPLLLLTRHSTLACVGAA